MKVNDSVINLYTSSNAMIVQLIRLRLSEVGIESQLFDDSISSVYPLSSLSSRIMVNKSDLALAKTIISEVEESLSKQRTDFDFRDADKEDIEFEKAVKAHDDKLENASLKNIIIFLIVAILVSFLVFNAFK